MKTNDNFDVIVMGGGIIGALSAYELTKLKKRVLLIDKYELGKGASGNSAAMTETQLDAHRGEPFFSIARASLKLFPSLHNEIKNLTGIDFQYEVCGILQLALSDEEANSLKNEVERQKKAGLKIEWLTSAQIREKFASITLKNLGGAFFAEDGQVNGAKFLEGCLTAAKKNGAIVIENAGEIQFVLANGKIAAVKISCGTFSAPHFIASAGAWTDQLLSPVGLRYGIEPIRGQLVVYDVPSATFPFPVYTKKDGYITPKRDGTTLAGTTVEEAGFENVTTEAGRKKIVSHAESLVRSIISFPVRHMTTGLRPRPSGDLPLIGPSKTFPNLIVAAGHYRNGVLLAPVTAKIVSALVANQKPPVDLAPFLPNA